MPLFPPFPGLPHLPGERETEQLPVPGGDALRPALHDLQLVVQGGLRRVARLLQCERERVQKE